MDINMHQQTIREAVGLFGSMEELQEAVRDLEVKAFPRQDISVIGSQKETEEVFGLPEVSPERAVDNPDTPRDMLVRPEEKVIGSGALIGGLAYIGAVIGFIAASSVSSSIVFPIVASGLIAGGIFGGILVWALSTHFNKRIEAQLRKGGFLLWVRTPDSRHERLACKVLKERGATRVKIHEIPV